MIKYGMFYSVYWYIIYLSYLMLLAFSIQVNWLVWVNVNRVIDRGTNYDLLKIVEPGDIALMYFLMCVIWSCMLYVTGCDSEVFYV